MLPFFSNRGLAKWREIMVKYVQEMNVKNIIIIAFAFAVRSAFALGTVQVSQMQESPWLDTEVFTNVAFRTGNSELRKIGVDMEFVGTPTNNVQVAFGHDADADGDLSDEEAQLVFGWESGRRFMSLPFEEYCIADEAAAQEAGSHRLHFVAQFNGMQRPVSFSLRDNALACLTGFEAQAHDWSGVRSWNMCKVTRRGVNEALEQIDVDAESATFVISIR